VLWGTGATIPEKLLRGVVVILVLAAELMMPFGKVDGHRQNKVW
jgi:hypothetical protein